MQGKENKMKKVHSQKKKWLRVGADRGRLEEERHKGVN